MKKVILASTSPRRIEIMKMLGIEFEVIGSGFDERTVDLKNPKRLVEALAYEKARLVSEKNPAAIVIGADTIVVLNKRILGKPKDVAEVRRTLRELSGTRHKIITGLAVIDSAGKREFVGSIVSSVKLKNILDKEIESYIATTEPLDRAGSYAVQGVGSMFVEEIKGDFFSIVGLPINILREKLNEFGIKTIV
ncbi:MAG TPA: nucleoside triphosphate pyrophosphatase [Patescibacteria group bacterium]|nr:nucleoside triphosphate pyrophosphatase [Patescibacteria group bacterium]